MKRLNVGILLFFVCCALPAAAQHGRAEWFRQARWGVFMHYLAESPEVPVEEWNWRIARFDVEGLARQLASVKAGYFFLTIGQNSGHYLAPNKTYDRFVGIHPSKCSRRDLVADLYTALHARGIPLLVYLPAGAPDRDKAAMTALHWQRGPYRNLEFQRMWQKVIGEWSVRWGSKVAGWWFDGCYWPNAMYRFPRPPNYASFARAARKGNPESIVAFNRGVVVPIHPESSEEDYTAGEINDALTARFSRDISQPHMLSYLGKWWSGAPPRYTDAQAVEITTKFIAKGGVVTWDVPRQIDGLIQEPFLRQLRLIGEAVAAMR